MSLSTLKARSSFRHEAGVPQPAARRCWPFGHSSALSPNHLLSRSRKTDGQPKGTGDGRLKRRSAARDCAFLFGPSYRLASRPRSGSCDTGSTSEYLVGDVRATGRVCLSVSMASQGPGVTATVLPVAESTLRRWWPVRSRGPPLWLMTKARGRSFSTQHALMQHAWKPNEPHQIAHCRHVPARIRSRSLLSSARMPSCIQPDCR